MNRWLFLAILGFTSWCFLLVVHVFDFYNLNYTIFFNFVLEGNYALLMILLDLFWISFMGLIINNLHNKQKAINNENLS